MSGAIAGIAEGCACGLPLPAAILSWQTWRARPPALSLLRLLRRDLHRLAGSAAMHAWTGSDGTWQFSVSRVWGITVIRRFARGALPPAEPVTYCIVPLVADVLTWSGCGPAGPAGPAGPLAGGARSSRVSPWAAARAYQRMSLLAATGTACAQAPALLELVAQMASPGLANDRHP